MGRMGRGWWAGAMLAALFLAGSLPAAPLAPKGYSGKLKVTVDQGVIKRLVLVVDVKTSYALKLDEPALALARLDGQFVEVLGVLDPAAADGGVLTVQQTRLAVTVPPLPRQVGVEMLYVGTVQVTRAGGAVTIRLVLDDQSSYDVKADANGQALVPFAGKRTEVAAVLQAAGDGWLLLARQARPPLTWATAAAADDTALVVGGKAGGGATGGGGADPGDGYPTAPNTAGPRPPAGSLTKQVSVDYQGVALQQVCADLTRQAGVPVSCVGVFNAKKVTYKGANVTLRQALDAIAAQLGSKLYERDGGYRFRQKD